MKASATTPRSSGAGEQELPSRRRRPLGSIPSNTSSKPQSASKQRTNSVTSRITFRKMGGRLRGNPFQDAENTTVEEAAKPPSPWNENKVPLDLLLKEQIEQLQQTQGTLTEGPHQALRQKLVNIQQGLEAIDAERLKLTARAADSQKQRKELEDELSWRQKELQSLQKRCAQQSEKLKNVHQLQAAHNALTVKFQENNAALEEQRQLVQQLQSQLETTQTKKEDLQDQLERVNDDYTNVTQQLDSSLQQLERLTQEKQQWQTERVRSEQQVTWQKQQQLVIWTEERSNLQEQINSKDDFIRLLQEQVAHLQKTERTFEDEMHQMTVRHEEELTARQAKETTVLTEIQGQHKTELESIRHEMESTKREFHSQLEQSHLQHEHDIATLRQEHRAEVAKEREGGNEMLRKQVEQHEKDEQALATEFEKLLADELKRTRQKYEKQIEVLQIELSKHKEVIKKHEHDEQELVSDFEKLLGKEIETVRQQHDEKVEALRNILSEHKQTIQRLQEQIESLQRSSKEEVSGLQLARDEAERRLQEEHDALVSELRGTIEQHQKQVEELLAAQDGHSHIIEELNSESERRILDLQCLHQNALDRLQKDAVDAIRSLQASLEEKQERVTELEGSIQEWERRYRGQSNVYSRSVADSKTIQKELTTRIESLTEEIKYFTDENRDKTRANEKLQLDSDVLKQEIVELQSKLEQQKTETGSQRLNSESRVASLEGVIKDLSSKVEEQRLTIESLENALEKAMQDLMVVSGELEMAKADSQLVSCLTADLEALQLENISAEEGLHDKNVQIAELEAEILKLEIENEIERQQNAKAESESASRKASHAREVQSLRNYIGELRRDLDQASRQLVDYRRLHSKSQSIVEQLEEELRLTHESADQNSTTSEVLRAQHAKEIQRVKKSYEVERQVLEERVRTLENDLIRASKAHCSQVKAKDNVIAKMSQELDDTREDKQRRVSDSHAEYALMREQLHTCRLELCRRDDELNNFKCQIIPQFESEVQDLKSGMEDFQQERDCLESDKTHAMKQRDDLVIALAEKSAKCDEMVHTIENQHLEIAEVSKNFRREQVQVHGLKSEMEKIMRRCHESESVNDLRVDLVAQIDELKRETSLRVTELDEEKTRNRELHSTIQQLRLDLEVQKERVAILIAAGDKAGQETERLTKDLQLKTRQVAEKTSKLGIINAELESCKQRLREEGSRAGNLELNVAEIKVERARLSTALEEKDAEYTAMVEHERVMKELSNQELQELRNKFELVNTEKQANANLHKEIAGLKNKIRRQEAYLQRRLNKDRMARQRGSNINDQDIYRDRAVKKSGSLASHASGPKPTVPEVSLIDWDSSFETELDSVLAD